MRQCDHVAPEATERLTFLRDTLSVVKSLASACAAAWSRFSREVCIVMFGDDRAGFVRKRDDGRWNPADTFMRKSRNFDTRSKAGAWLQKEIEHAIAAGEL